MSEQVIPPSSCSERVHFLSGFAPIMGNNSAMAEVRSTFGRNPNSNPNCCLDFTQDSFEAYAALIKELILEDRPRVLIVHGQAGDGKTAFLYRFFRDIMLGKKVESLELFKSYHRIQLENSPDMECEIYCVFDLSELHNMGTEYQQVMHDVFTIVTSENTPEANKKLKAQGLNRIIILAANNGILLQFFEKVIDSPAFMSVMASAITENNGDSGDSKDVSRQEIWQEQIVESLRQHFLGGNMTQFISELTCQGDEADDEDDSANNILQFFSSDDVSSSGNDDSTDDVHRIAFHLLNNKAEQSKSARMVLFDMSGRIDRDLLGRIIDNFFDGQFFAQCDQCYKDYCPLLKNYEVLKNNDFAALKVGLSQLIDLQASNGYHINTRAVLMLLSNALLGCAKPATREKCHFDCETIHNDLSGLDNNNALLKGHVHVESCYLPDFYNDDDNFQDRKHHFFITNPYDNIFGLNLNLRGNRGWQAQDALLENMACKQDISQDQYGVFRVMCKTGLGDHSNVYWDSVINALLDDVCEQHEQDKVLSWVKQRVKKNFIAESLLEAIKKLKDKEEELFESNQDSSEELKNNSQYKQIKQEHFALMGSLRRALFFCLQPMPDFQSAENNEWPQNVQTDLFAFSVFPHALDFLSFWLGEHSSPKSGYNFIQLWRDLLLYRDQQLDPSDQIDRVQKLQLRNKRNSYKGIVKCDTAVKLSKAMAKFLDGSDADDDRWFVVESTTNSLIELDEGFIHNDTRKCVRLSYDAFSDKYPSEAGWYFMASEDSLHLPQFVYILQEEDDDENSLDEHYYTVAFPITALNFETLMQISDGALEINFTSRLCNDLLRFKQSLGILLVRKEQKGHKR